MIDCNNEHSKSGLASARASPSSPAGSTICGAVIVMTPFGRAVRGSLEGSRGGRVLAQRTRRRRTQRPRYTTIRDSTESASGMPEDEVPSAAATAGSHRVSADLRQYSLSFGALLRTLCWHEDIQELGWPCHVLTGRPANTSLPGRPRYPRPHQRRPFPSFPTDHDPGTLYGTVLGCRGSNGVSGGFLV
jgi:hypothetical protein